jgi:hypothetical protein
MDGMVQLNSVDGIINRKYVIYRKMLTLPYLDNRQSVTTALSVNKTPDD